MKYKILFFIILIFSLFLRLYKVSDTPHDLYVDEVSIGYNAYSILKTGRDEWGEKFPVYFKAYGEYKLPVYIYLTSLTQMILGYNSLSVRLPSVILGSLSVGLLMHLIKYLTHNIRNNLYSSSPDVTSGSRRYSGEFSSNKEYGRSNKLSLIAGLMLTISPWHLQFSRAGFEAIVALFFFLLGIILILFSRPFLKRINLSFLLGIIILIISVYSYSIYRLFTPLFFLSLIFLYKNDFFALLKNNKSRSGLLLAMLLSIPIIFNIFSPSALKRVRSQSFLLQVKGTAEDLFYMPEYLSLIQYAKNYFSYFSLDFHYFQGDGNGRHSVREIGESYLWQLPFFILGLYLSFKKRAVSDKFFLIFFFLAPIAPSLVIPNPHSLRSLMMVVPIIYFISRGLLSFLQFLKYRIYSIQQFNNKITILYFLLSILISYFFLSYLHIYYRHYPKRTSPDWSGGYRQAIEYITGKEENYDFIFISDNLQSGYAFLYFYGKINREEVLQSNDHTLGSGKYRFVFSPFNEKLEGKVLYLAPYWEKWPGRELSKIYNRGNDHVFTIWEN